MKHRQKTMYRICGFLFIYRLDRVLGTARLCLTLTPAWYSVPAFLFMIIPVGMIYGIITIKTKSIWPAIFLHAAHNTFDQLIFGTVTVSNNKMFFVSETGIFTIIFAWIVAVFLYKKCND